MLNTPQPIPQAEPQSALQAASAAAGVQRLDVLFRHVLQTQAGRHLWQLVLQYRRGGNP